jgi:hypothetical protein
MRDPVVRRHHVLLRHDLSADRIDPRTVHQSLISSSAFDRFGPAISIARDNTTPRNNR